MSTRSATAPLQIAPAASYAAACARAGLLELGIEARSCIETTRVLVGALELLGIRARAVAVDVQVFNLEAAPYIAQGIPVSRWPRAAYAIGTAPAPDAAAFAGGGWSGHLVAVVRESVGARRIVDASADQFNRRGLLEVAGVVSTEITRDWSPLDPQARRLQDGRTVIRYAPIPPADPRAAQWRTTPAWTRDPDWFEDAARAIAEQVLAGHDNRRPT